MTKARPLLRVVKVGGSLLPWPELPQALKRWLATEPAAINVLLCGGGTFADGIREASRAHAIREEAAHWLAIDCLTVTARLLATICRLELVSDYTRMRDRVRATEPSLVVCDARDFLINHEPSLPGNLLPPDWTATSDSIAARLAEAMQFDEVVLLKSRKPPAIRLAALAAAGYVDERFAIASAGIPAVRVICLRDEAARSL